ncbi:MAG TPA: phosphoribosylformylglycinamidine cyclo-ligase, partial [Methanothrix sp.]|nr:phosphoribosylformylglycinamidine cyclo-ligase [Methanothrix sp.]
MKKMTYADSGVDIRAEEKAISAMKSVMTGRRKGIGAPITDIGHYAGLIDMGEYAIAMTTDGVGS